MENKDYTLGPRKKNKIHAIVEACLKSSLEFSYKEIDTDPAGVKNLAFISIKTQLRLNSKGSVKEEEYQYANERLQEIFDSYIHQPKTVEYIESLRQKHQVEQFFQNLTANKLSSIEIDNFCRDITHQDARNIAIEKSIEKGFDTLFFSLTNTNDVNLLLGHACICVTFNQKHILQWCLDKNPALLHHSKDYLLYFASFYDKREMQMFLVDQGADTSYLQVRLSNNPEKYEWLEHYRVSSKNAQELVQQLEPKDKTKNKPKI